MSLDAVAIEGGAVPGHVLYIEDDDALRALYSEFIRDTGLTVAEEKFAEAALDALRRRRPDVVLLNLGMPVGHMSGIEMLARVRQNPEWLHIPVVVFSGFGDVVNPDVMARLNVSYVLSKASVRGDELARLLRDLVQRLSGPRTNNGTAAMPRPEADQPRHLLVVARDRLLLYEHLKNAFADHESVQVLLDRRAGERRQKHVATVPERRRRERRESPARIDEQIQTIGWSLVLLDIRRSGRN